MHTEAHGELIHWNNEIRHAFFLAQYMECIFACVVNQAQLLHLFCLVGLRKLRLHLAHLCKVGYALIRGSLAPSILIR